MSVFCENGKYSNILRKKNTNNFNIFLGKAKLNFSAQISIMCFLLKRENIALKNTVYNNHALKSDSVFVDKNYSILALRLYL